MHFVYFAISLKNKKVYVGKTKVEPQRRVEQHNNGSNNFTKQNRPLKLIYYEMYHCKKDASLKEKWYKTGFGKKIKKIIVNTLINGGYSSVG